MINQKYFTYEFIRIPIIYLIMGVIWIILTDSMSYMLSGVQYEIFQTFKGLLFVVVTAILLYYLVWQQIYKLNKLNSILEEKVEKRTQVLRQINKDKDDIMSIAVHDLKNPLSAILLQTDVIKAKYDTLTKVDIIQRLDKIAFTSARMSQIITNLLGINAIESGKIKSVCIEQNVSLFMIDLITHYQFDTKNKNTDIISEITNDIIYKIDALLMQEILDNLISNAIKFSPFNSKIYIRLEAINDKIRIEIEDCGPGFTAEDIELVFTKFAHLSAKPTAGENSTGLGLFIVKKLVDLLGGTIELESEINKGSKFILTI